LWFIPDLYDGDKDGIADESWRRVFSSYTVGHVKMLFQLGSDDEAELNGTGAAVRYVLIPGLTEGRLAGDLKNMSYENLAKLFNIRD